jgi:hypothetical protein
MIKGGTDTQNEASNTSVQIATYRAKPLKYFHQQCVDKPTLG